MDRKRSKKKWREEKRNNERVKVGHDDMMITLAPSSSSSRILTDDVSRKRVIERERERHRERERRGRSEEMKKQGISHEGEDIFATSGIGFLFISFFISSFLSPSHRSFCGRTFPRTAPSNRTFLSGKRNQREAKQK